MIRRDDALIELGNVLQETMFNHLVIIHNKGEFHTVQFSSLHFSTMNSWISIPVCRAPPCILSITSSPTLSEVTGIAGL